jgi:hypothetical protein
MAQARVKRKIEGRGNPPQVFEMNSAPRPRLDNEPKPNEVHRIPARKNIVPSAEDLIKQIKQIIR